MRKSKETISETKEAGAPSDLAQVWSTHARKQFEMLTEQAKELTSLGQRLASSNMEPLARNVSQAFKKAS